MDKELLQLLEQELGCQAAARLLEPEMAARVDAGEEAGALPPLLTAAPKAEALPEGGSDGSWEVDDSAEEEPVVDEFHRGEQFARRVRQRCLALLLHDCGGGEGEFEHTWVSWFAHTTLSAETRAG